jgi:hypothetical protein
VSAFTWDDTVRVKLTALSNSAENERSGAYLARFPRGTIYTIEFEDGSAVEIEEALLEKGAFPGEDAVSK